MGDGVVASFVTAAHFLTAALNDCNYGFNFAVACASDVLKLTAVVNGIAMKALAIHGKCGAPTTRRLSNATHGSPESPSLSDVEVAYLAKLNMTEEEMIVDPKRVILA